MKCPHCAAENKDAAKFCGKCGLSLVAPSAQHAISKSCPGCGNACKPDAKFCPKCGHNFSATTPAETTSHSTEPGAMPCPHCGAALKPGAKFCGKCGKSITDTNQENPQPVPVTAEEITPPPIAVAIEFPDAAPPVVADNPVQPLAEPIPNTGRSTVPAAETLPPAPTTKTPATETAGNKNPKPSRKVPLVPIVVGVAVLVIALGAGGYILMKGKSSPDSNEATIAKPAIQPAASPAPTPPPLAVAPQPEELPPPNLNKGAPNVAPTPPSSLEEKPSVPTPPPAVEKKPAAPIPAQHPSTTLQANKPKHSANEAMSAQEKNRLQAAIDASLEEGEQCMSRKKFDCAISSANTILRLDSSNTRALDMKRKAKEAQDRALSQIDIQ